MSYTCHIDVNGHECGRRFANMSKLRGHVGNDHPQVFTKRFQKKNGKETRKVPNIAGEIKMIENTPREALRIQLTAKRDRYDAMLRELEDL